MLHQFDKTIEIGEKVIIDTNSTLVKRLLAYSYVKKTPPDAAKAMQWFNAYWDAVKTNPKAIIATDYEVYGKAFQLQGNDVEAVKNYELSIEMEKAKGAEGAPNFELYNAVAEMYKEKKDTVKRIYYLRKFVQSNTSGKYHLLLLEWSSGFPAE